MHWGARPHEPGLNRSLAVPVAILVLPDLEWLTRRLTLGGGCGTSLRWAWTEVTALLFGISAGMGQLHRLLRQPTPSRLPNEMAAAEPQ